MGSVELVALKCDGESRCDSLRRRWRARSCFKFVESAGSSPSSGAFLLFDDVPVAVFASDGGLED